MTLALLLAAQEITLSTISFRPVVADTTLIQTRSRENFGREQYILGGDGRVALLKFPDIGYRKPAGMKVKSATLTLTLLRPDSVGKVSVKRMLKAWGEGRGRSVPNVSSLPGDPLSFGNSSWEWAENGVTDGKWAFAGASHESDARDIEGATAEQNGARLTLSALGEVAQSWIDRPLDNQGLRLTFSKDAAFYSADNGENGPKLDIEWESVQTTETGLAVTLLEPTKYEGEQSPSSWEATVMNVGSTSVSGTGDWLLPNGKTQSIEFGSDFQPGESKKTTINLPTFQSYGDPRRVLLTIKVSAPGDSDNSDNVLVVPVHGASVFFGSGEDISSCQKAVGFLNTVVLPFSRFGFAPEGVAERFRLVSKHEGADVVVRSDSAKQNNLAWPWPSANSQLIDRLVKSLVPIDAKSLNSEIEGLRSPLINRGQLGILPDTRDDGMRFAGLTMPNIDWYLPRPIDPVYLEQGFLSRVEAGFLTANIGKRGKNRSWKSINLPTGLVVRFLDTQGNPIESGSASIYGLNGSEIAAKPIVTSKLERGGFLAAKIDGKISLESPWLVTEINQGGDKERALVSIWDLYDWVSRGNTVAASADVVLMASNTSIDETANLCTDKIITDSDGRFPAELAVLIDGDPKTGLVLKPGSWIEVDLSRDRTFGAIELSSVGSFFEAVEMFSFKTGQNPTEAKPFYRDLRAKVTSGLFGQKFDSGSSLTYKAASVQSRYVRIINSGSTEVNLSEIKVRPAKTN